MLYKKGHSGVYEFVTRFLSNKLNLLLVLSLSLSSIIVYPLLVPHLIHPSMVYHILIHILSLDISIFLTVISFISYKKLRSKRLLLTSLSFMFLVVIEVMYLLQAGQLMSVLYIPLIEIDFSHILLTCMIVLFAWGVLKVDKKH